MRVLTDATAPVKPREPSAPASTAPRPRFDCVAQDRAYWGETGPEYYTDEPDWDQLAAEAHALDLLERGLDCDDTARLFGRGEDDHADALARGQWGYGESDRDDQGEPDHGDAECRNAWGGHGVD